jgi:hypothetical protein
MKNKKVLKEYNYIVSMGWVVVIKDNKVINYHADCGDGLIDGYAYENKVFMALVEEMQDTVDITDVISVCNDLRANVWEKFKTELR